VTPSSEDHHLFCLPEKLDFRNAVAAIIVLDDGRFLMQLRDDKPAIFYPDHWGLFGGAVEDGEEPEEALRRELQEELGLVAGSLRYFTRMDFDFMTVGSERCYRIYYELSLSTSDLAGLRLGEGRLMEPMLLPELLIERRLVPYDSFALWLHFASGRRGSGVARPALPARDC
jgi:8-oxo-dGTP pyrophosphatase MutT (NUDIX family)